MRLSRKAICLLLAVCIVGAGLILLFNLPAGLVFPVLADSESIQTIDVRIDRGGTEWTAFTIADPDAAAEIVDRLAGLRLIWLGPSQAVTYGEAGIIDLWIGDTHLCLNDLGDVRSDTTRYRGQADRLAALIDRITAMQP